MMCADSKHLVFAQAYGSKEEDVEKYMRNGIITWGKAITKVQDDGKLLVNQVSCTFPSARM